MGEDKNKSDDDRFEESLRQILDGAPSGSRGTAGRPPKPLTRPENGGRETADKAETEPKTLFWFKLVRPLALLALLVLLAKFVLRITSER
ncbi:MAG: hypothetical protein LBB74_09375 [Chitinispirillales bacterium]|jgi:hypothetical protein|nr:hypothetical protein [Chitinispirillales bacterium]